MALDGGVFGRQAEGIPTHRMQHIEALHAAIARDDVADRVIAHVTHVDVARRIREHLEHVLLGASIALRRLMGAGCFPRSLPARLDILRIVLFHAYRSPERTKGRACADPQTDAAQYKAAPSTRMRPRCDTCKNA